MDNKKQFLAWQHHTCTNETLRTLQQATSFPTGQESMSQDTLLLRDNSLDQPLPFLPFPILPCSCHPQPLQAAAHPQSSSSEPSFSHTLGDGSKTNKCYCGAKKNISAILLLPPGLITWPSKHPVLASYSMHTLPGSARGPSPAQGRPPNPSGKPACFLLAAKGWTLQRTVG